MSYSLDFNSLNLYLTTRFNSGSWDDSISTAKEFTGTWSSNNNYYLESVNGSALSEIVIGDYVYYNKQPAKVVQVVSDNKIKLDTLFNVSTKIELYKLNEENYNTAITLNKSHSNCFETSKNFVLLSGNWDIPNPYPTAAILGIFEYTYWLFTTNGVNEALEDLNNGILEKKIDVLQWKYDKDLVQTLLLGSTESKAYLKAYETGINGLGGVFNI